VIICSRCGKENQDQFKYCLGCGSKLQVAVPRSGGSLQGASGRQEPALWHGEDFLAPAAHRRGRSRVRCGLSGHAFPGHPLPPRLRWFGRLLPLARLPM